MRVIKLKMNKFSLVRIFGGSSWLAVRLHRLKLAIAGATSLRWSARFPAGTPTPLRTYPIRYYTEKGPARVHSQTVAPSLDTITLLLRLLGSITGHGMLARR